MELETCTGRAPLRKLVSLEQEPEKPEQSKVDYVEDSPLRSFHPSERSSHMPPLSCLAAHRRGYGVTVCLA